METNIDLSKESRDLQLKALSSALHRKEKLKILKNPKELAILLAYQVAKHHQKMLDFVTRKSNGRSLVLAPRGAGKSSIISIVLVLWLLLNNPNLRILIVSNSQSQATGFLREIKQHCEQNKILNFLFGNLIGEKWSEIEIDLGIREKFSKEPNISAYGIFGALIGKHYDIIIMDDVVDQEIANSATQRAKLEAWVGMSLIPTLEPHGKVIVIGTRYHTSDLYGRFIKTKYKDNFIRIKAVNDDNTSYWPEYFPMDVLDDTKTEIGPVFFNAQYQNNPYDMVGGLFKPEWFNTRWMPIDERNGYISVPEKESVNYGILKISQGFDQAIGMKNFHDFSCHVTLGQHEQTGDIYILEVIKKRLTFIERINLVINQYIKWKNLAGKLTSVGVEATGFQDDLCFEVMRLDPAVPIKRIKPHRDKTTRAEPLARLAENGKLFLGVGPSFDSMYEEFILFPGGDHDDQVDASEMALQGLRRIARALDKPPGM